MVAENFNSFGQAILNKLIAEIADLELGCRGRRASRAPGVT
jgi:hypothetical protein